MRNLLTDPLWQRSDLGRAIPDSPHAVSVCLPTWADNVGYEEQEPRVVDCMQSGYPRFFYHPFCQRFFAECRRRFAAGGEECLAFPSERSAGQFQRFLRDQTGDSGRSESFGMHDVHVVRFPRALAPAAKLGWQHCGSGISSRQAEACLSRREIENADTAKQTVRERIAELCGASADDVFLFPCGMNAIVTVHRALLRMFPGRKSAQFGFPYVDTLKILEKIGPGVHFFPRGDTRDFASLSARVKNEPPAGVYTEFPSNPLLRSPDLCRLGELCRGRDVPLIVDETISGFANADVFPAADVICSSLTKFFSGAGDVAAGSVVLNAKSPFYADLESALRCEYEDTFWPEDAVVLERNSRDYAARITRINHNASTVAAYFADRPEIDTISYPQLTDVELYEPFRKPGGGFGGLLSIQMKDAPANAPRFFDALRVCKGPNLGTNFTLACPFTILAHYHELEFVESHGVSRWLIRISIGLEDTGDLIERFDAAL